MNTYTYTTVTFSDDNTRFTFTRPITQQEAYNFAYRLVDRHITVRQSRRLFYPYASPRDMNVKL